MTLVQSDIDAYSILTMLVADVNFKNQTVSWECEHSLTLFAAVLSTGECCQVP